MDNDKIQTIKKVIIALLAVLAACLITAFLFKVIYLLIVVAVIAVVAFVLYQFALPKAARHFKRATKGNPNE